MAIFGKTDIGGSFFNNFTWSDKRGCKYQATGSGQITAGSAYFHVATAGKNWFFAVYSDNAGAPNALLGVSDVLVLAVSAAAWRDFTFSVPVNIVNGTNYWLAILNSGSNYDYYYAAGDVNQAARLVDVPPPSDPFGAPTYQNFAYSIYATYTPTAKPLVTHVRIH